MTESAITSPMFQLADVLRDLVRAMSSDQADGMSSERVVQFAASAVPGADEAAISTVNGTGRATTVAASGNLAADVDRLQHEVGEGPGMQALVQSDIAYAPDLTTDAEWPTFSQRAVQESGVRCILSFRLYLTSERRAALTFYAKEPRAIDEDAIGVGAIFASYASLTLLNEMHRDKAIHLSRALESNREIGVAIGILMSRDLSTQEQAFDRLRSASQHLNRKLRDIAELVRQTGELPSLR